MPIIQLNKVQDVYKQVKKLNLEEKWELLNDLIKHIQYEERELRRKIREKEVKQWKLKKI